MKRETSRDMDQHGKKTWSFTKLNKPLNSINHQNSMPFHPKDFIPKGNLLLKGPRALSTRISCLINHISALFVEVKELGRRLLELHHASCRRHSENCRVDSVASWFHGNCTCRIFHRQLCVCVPPKKAGGI